MKKTIVVKGKQFNLKAVAAGMAQKQKIYKPSANIVRLKAIVAKMLAKPQPKAKAVITPINSQPRERSSFLKKYFASMAIEAKELKAISQQELIELTDEELELLSRKIIAAKRQRGYNKNRGNK